MELFVSQPIILSQKQYLPSIMQVILQLYIQLPDTPHMVEYIVLEYLEGQILQEHLEQFLKELYGLLQTM